MPNAALKLRFLSVMALLNNGFFKHSNHGGSVRVAMPRNNVRIVDGAFLNRERSAAASVLEGGEVPDEGVIGRAGRAPGDGCSRGDRFATC